MHKSLQVKLMVQAGTGTWLCLKWLIDLVNYYSIRIVEYMWTMSWSEGKGDNRENYKCWRDRIEDETRLMCVHDSIY